MFIAVNKSTKEQNKNKEILDKFATIVVNKDAVFTNANGSWGVDQNKAYNYTPDKYSEDIVLWNPPFNCLRFEFEDEPEVNRKIISAIEANAKSLGYDYCVTEHKGAKSPYFNMFDLPMADNADDWKSIKQLLIAQLIPSNVIGKLDRTNLGFTLSPVIGHSHWKPKYNGSIHEIVRGKHPLEHKNSEHKKLKEFIKTITNSRKKITDTINKIEKQQKWVSDFLLNYCCKNKLPRGQRHAIISKNLAILIAFREDQDEIMNSYLNAQESKHNDVITWITSVKRGEYSNVSTGELRKYIIENNIEYEIKDTRPVEDEIEKTLHDLASPYLNVQELYKRIPFCYDENGLYWFWDNEYKKWNMKDDTGVMVIIDKAFNNPMSTISSKIKGEYLEAIKRIGRLNKPANPPKECIQFKDMVFNIKTKEIKPATPEYFFCNPLPWSIADTSETPVIDSILESWVDQKDIENEKKRLYEVIAYCCLSDYPIHVVVALCGSGRNGKSKFINLIKNFIGQTNCASTELDVLLNSRFETSKLYKKLVCMMGETNFGVMNKTSILKKLSGQDLISYEFKGKTGFDDLNYATILISSNSLPTSDDTSDGFYRRWLLIDFPNEFPEGKDILETIPEEEYNHLARKVIEILPELLNNGIFTNQGNIEERKRKYIMMSNPLKTFMSEICKEKYGGYIRYSELYTAYTYYLYQHKKRVVNKKQFGEALAMEGIDIEKTSKNLDGAGWQSDRFINHWVLKDNWKELSNPHDSHDIYDSKLNSFPYKENELKSESYLSQKSQDNEIFEVTEEKIGQMSDKELEMAKMKGDIYEPKPGVYKPLN